MRASTKKILYAALQALATDALLVWLVYLVIAAASGPAATPQS